MSKTLLLLISSFMLITCLEEPTEVDIELGGFDTTYIGKKGTIALYPYYYSTIDSSDTTRAISFKANITNESSNSYEVGCGVFKAEGQQLYIFCEIDENIPTGKYIINLAGITGISFGNYNINLKQSRDFTFEKADINLPDIYSDSQTINVEEGTDIYDVKFKIISYNNEKIILNFVLFLDCEVQSNELICHIPKKDLDKISKKEQSKMGVGTIYYYTKEKYFPLVPYINVKYKNIKVENIYVGITKLIQDTLEHDVLAAYETDVTSVSNIFAIDQGFGLNFINEDGSIKEGECFFRKYDNTPLLILCWVNKDGKNWLKEITEEITVSNANFKYLFRIQPVKNDDIIYYDGSEGAYGSFITWVYPEVLDFTKSDTLTLEFSIENPDSITGITLNENADDLVCETIKKPYKRCVVPKSHFQSKSNGYYFIKHNNHLNSKSINYEIPPIKVILEEDSPDTTTPSSDSSDNFINLNFYYYLALLVLILV